MRARLDRLRSLAVAWTALRVLSCGGESLDPAGTPDPDEGTTFRTPIEAARGGTVSTAQGGGQLAIEAGVLGEDTEVTLRPGPAEAGSVTSVYDVGPEGVAFTPYAILSLSYDGDPGPGRTVALARLDGGTWSEVAGSVVSEGRLAGKVKGSGRYAGILKDIKADPVVDCPAAARDFAPCGGDILGTWRLLGSCAEGAPFLLDPPAYCPERTGTWSLEQTGTFTVSETSESIFLDRDVKTASFTAPASCFQEGATCGEVATMDDWATSCTKDAGGCRCSGQHLNPARPNTPVPLIVDGTDLVLKDASGAEIARQAFCAHASTAVVRTLWSPAGADPIPVLWVLSR